MSKLNSFMVKSTIRKRKQAVDLGSVFKKDVNFFMPHFRLGKVLSILKKKLQLSV